MSQNIVLNHDLFLCTLKSEQMLKRIARSQQLFRALSSAVRFSLPQNISALKKRQRKQDLHGIYMVTVNSPLCVVSSAGKGQQGLAVKQGGALHVSFLLSPNFFN